MERRLIEGRERKYCTECGEILYRNPIPATAAIVINERDEMLLVKRNIEPGKDKWSLPGGFIEIDEDPREGCLRELREETSLEGEIDSIVEAFTNKSSMYDSVLVIGYRIKNTRGEIEAGDDAGEVSYFAIDSLPPIAFSSHRKLVKSVLGKVYKDEKY